jgi:ubiquitin carboxyl-terminal hydrolase 5/13
VGIGVEGGFRAGGPPTVVETRAALVALDASGGRATVPLPAPDLPDAVLAALNAVAAAESGAAAQAADAWEETRAVSRYAAGLPQLEHGMGAHGRTIPADPAAWKCDETGVADNLWLNLSTGFIGSGRANFDGTGGNGAAKRHFEATGGKYPLVVKLGERREGGGGRHKEGEGTPTPSPRPGTITPTSADVHSYAPDEDDMVLDPHLDAHLAHWGVRRGALAKTDKSMAELQVDLNLSFDAGRATEAGVALDPVAGPHAVGLTNLGNSCYAASVVQALWAVPALRGRYGGAAGAALLASAPGDAAADVLTQTAKLALALESGETGAEVAVEGQGGDAATPTPTPLQTSVRPSMFKAVVGRGHPEFSTGRQQDAVEFLQHWLDVLARAERAGAARVEAATAAATAGGAAPPPTDLLTADALRFAVEDRVACGATGAVRYGVGEANVLSLDIPLDAATNAAAVAAAADRDAKRARVAAEGAAAYIGAGGEVEKAAGDGGGGAAAAASPPSPPVLPRVPLAACLAKWGADETIEGYKSAAAGGAATRAARRARLASFPPFLAIQLNRYYVAADWTPQKLEVEVDVPEALDLGWLRATGPVDGEVLQPDDDDGARAGAAAAAAPAADPAIVAAVVGMGFSEAGAARAALATQVGGRGEGGRARLARLLAPTPRPSPHPQNAGAEAAMEWVLAHMGDADFNDPPPPAGGGAGGALPAADPDSVAALAAMGFDARAATAALAATAGSLERAADWLFSRADGDLAAAVDAALAGGGRGGSGSASAPTGTRPPLDGPPHYTLVALVSHVGRSTGCGHYVAHARRGGRWLMLNDDRVAASASVPTDVGYLYMYQRDDVAGGL